MAEAFPLAPTFHLFQDVVVEIVLLFAPVNSFMSQDFFAENIPLGYSLKVIQSNAHELAVVILVLRLQFASVTGLEFG